MDGKPLRYFPDELRVRIGGNCVGAAPFARTTARSIARPQAPDVWAPMQTKNPRRRIMNPKSMWILGTSGALLAGGIGLAMVMAEPTKGPVFIAGDKPVTEEQVRQKLQSEGWSNIQIARDGRYLEATGSKDGQASNMEVDSRTGRLRAGDGDDDDDDE
jgi:hypothetical protein